MSHRKAERAVCRFRRLFVDRHFRDTQQRFVVEGVRSFIALAESQWEFESIVVSQKLFRSLAAQRWLKKSQAQGSDVVEVTVRQFRSIGTMSRASGIAAIVVQKRRRLTNLTRKNGVWIALSDIQSAGNAGSLTRTAAAVDANGFILVGQSIDQYAPAMLRASMGAFARQDFYRATWEEFIAWKRAAGVQVVGACPSAQQIYSDLPWASSSVIMLGEERRGLSSRQRQSCDRLVRLPMSSRSDSLNLAVAGSILLYDFRRNHCDLPAHSSD